MNDLERIELDAAADFWAAAPAHVRAALALDVHEVAGARCFRCRVLQPTLMFRRAVQVAPMDGAGLDELARHMGALGEPWTVGFAPSLSREALARKLAERGFGASYAWMKFLRPCHPLAAQDTELSVRVLGPGDGAAFASVVTQCYALEGAAAAWLAMLPGRARWVTVAAFDGVRAVGAAAAYVDGDHTWLGFAATLPDARRRGAQGALLARRINEAAARGARVAVTETGERVADKLSHSYRNILRVGFEEAYLRTHWIAPR